jgi:hypothetical protein
MRTGILIPNSSGIRLILIIDTDDQMIAIQQEPAEEGAEDDLVALDLEMTTNLLEVLQHFIAENGTLVMPADFQIVRENQYVN